MYTTHKPIKLENPGYFKDPGGFKDLLNLLQKLSIEQPQFSSSIGLEVRIKRT